MMRGACMLGMCEVGMLVVLGLGYIVCYLASKTTKNLRALGYGIGTFIITLSLIFLLLSLFVCGGARKAGMCSKAPGMPMMQQPQK